MAFSSKCLLVFCVIIAIFVHKANGGEPGEVDRDIKANFQDIFGIAFSSFAIMIAAGGGIGGGCLMVPILIIILDFNPKTAIPISSIGVLGASLANLVINWRKRHPVADRPLIAWNIIFMMEPLTVFGTIVGSYINVVSPPWLLVIMLVVLLGATSIKITKKALRLFRAESVKIRRKTGLLASQERSITDGGGVQGKGQGQGQGQDQGYGAGSDFSSQGAGAFTDDLSRDVTFNKNNRAGNKFSMVSRLGEKERSHNWTVIVYILFLTLGVCVLSVLKGGGGINLLNLNCGSWQYWAMAMAVLPFSVIIYFVSRRFTLKRYYTKEIMIENDEYAYEAGDVKWTPRNTVVYPLICSIAGVFAGLFGIGGGVVKGPLMLEMKVLPAVASATSATMIIFTSSSATLQYTLFKALNFNFAPVYFGLGFVSALIGRTGLNMIVSRYNRPSLIVFLIGGVVGMSSIAMAAEFTIDLIEGTGGHNTGLC